MLTTFATHSKCIYRDADGDEKEMEMEMEMEKGMEMAEMEMEMETGMEMAEMEMEMLPFLNKDGFVSFGWSTGADPVLLDEVKPQRFPQFRRLDSVERAPAAILRTFAW